MPPAAHVQTAAAKPQLVTQTTTFPATRVYRTTVPAAVLHAPTAILPIMRPAETVSAVHARSLLAPKVITSAVANVLKIPILVVAHLASIAIPPIMQRMARAIRTALAPSFRAKMAII